MVDWKERSEDARAHLFEGWKPETRKTRRQCFSNVGTGGKFQSLQFAFAEEKEVQKEKVPH